MANFECCRNFVRFLVRVFEPPLPHLEVWFLNLLQAVIKTVRKFSSFERNSTSAPICNRFWYCVANFKNRTKFTRDFKSKFWNLPLPHLEVWFLNLLQAAIKTVHKLSSFERNSKSAPISNWLWCVWDHHKLQPRAIVDEIQWSTPNCFPQRVAP